MKGEESFFTLTEPSKRRSDDNKKDLHVSELCKKLTLQFDGYDIETISASIKLIEGYSKSIDDRLTSARRTRRS